MNQEVDNQIGGAEPPRKRGVDRRIEDLGIEERRHPPYLLMRSEPQVDRRRIVSARERAVLMGDA